MLPPPENAAKMVRRMYAPPLFERRLKMLEYLCSLARNAGKWVLRPCVFEMWMEEGSNGWPCSGW